MSKLVPGDQAESLLVLQGVTPDSKSSAVEYKRNYMALRMDKPSFYFSLVPDFYPYNINSIADPTQKYQTKSLLKQKISYQDIVKYTAQRDILIKTISNPSSDTTGYEEQHNRLKNLYFSTDVSEIQSECRALESKDSSEPFVMLRKYADALTSHQKTTFLPSFHWHGSDNQFHHWVIEVLQGNFGVSLKDGGSVSEKISSAMGWTFILLFLNLIFTFIIAIPTGIYSGFYQNGLFDKTNNIIWLVLYSVPVFWLASMMIIYFTSGRYGQWLNIFPTPGMWYVPPNQSIWMSLYQYSGQLVLPVFCLVANDIAQLGRICRNNVIVQKSKQYVLMAKAKGHSNIQVLIKHI
ncbi:MAG: ABC transporter permease, partial [Saprospiraceae bacterium]